MVQKAPRDHVEIICRSKMGIGTQDINKKLKRDSGRLSTPRKDLQIWAPINLSGFSFNNDVNVVVGEGEVCELLPKGICSHWPIRSESTSTSNMEKAHLWQVISPSTSASTSNMEKAHLWQVNPEEQTMKCIQRSRKFIAHRQIPFSLRCKFQFGRKLKLPILRLDYRIDCTDKKAST
ncbi:hypothetical protein C5167_019915 [Papaver somniferum]|uniref:Uncharacterized protein n=1 Tax=Papaver somniferum TaxID=3469 RepID=A0A4Y7IUV9_PAPSO|nr:hypothetical protein C5167_019915 [Papaver somniferum]